MYETVIGLEVHVQLSTESKAFCGDSTAFGAAPNTHISAISLGHPGTLPRLNKRQVAFAVRLAMALGCKINTTNYFDRKNYFYADSPKGYQITQDRQPICVGGSLEIEVDGKKKHIRLHHIHMEEDAGKSIHDTDPHYSFIDLNRAGTPLLEVVTEPDLRSADEVAAFMTTLRQLVRYLDISDGNMEEGSLRCDCNVSVRQQGETQYNNRCEVKNMNSMRYAKRAIEYEVKRQIGIMESGGRVAQETLNFDPETGITTPLRSKEDANDYRYFPEPDLPPVVLSEQYLKKIEDEMPPLPKVLFEQFTTVFGLSPQDAFILTEEKETALFFIDFTQKTSNYKAAANLTINKIRPYLQEKNISWAAFPIEKENLAAFIQLIDEGKVSSAIAYQRIFPALIEQPTLAPMLIAEELNLVQNSDNDFLQKVAQEVLAAFPEKVKEYQKGKKGLIGFFMGELMKRSQGKADPKTGTAILVELLGR
jgi:aspartyl-tRNA(Asn)/glutamyl-tRNA(Gln) amidotransferase subunit B